MGDDTHPTSAATGPDTATQFARTSSAWGLAVGSLLLTFGGGLSVVGLVVGLDAATAVGVIGAALGAVFLATGWLLAPAFSDAPDVQDAITAALVVVAVSLPMAGWVFVLDGVLIGAGDGRYLARAGLVTLVGYLPLVAVVGLTAPGGTAGLVWLWVVFGFGFMGVRAATLGRRARGEAWMVTGVSG